MLLLLLLERRRLCVLAERRCLFQCRRGSLVSRSRCGLRSLVTEAWFQIVSVRVR